MNASDHTDTESPVPPSGDASDSQLLALLNLIVEHVERLEMADLWEPAQIESLRHAVTPPLSPERLALAEQHMRNVLSQQMRAQGRMQDVQQQMKALISTFVTRLSEMAQSSDALHTRMETLAADISKADTVADITPLLSEAVQTARTMADDAARSRGQMKQLETQVRSADAEIHRLQFELEHIRQQARHDPLTGALNRKGLDEVMARELATMKRRSAALCVVMLDIDHFKHLNDTLGHSAGDSALVYLARLSRQTLRPADTVARLGGEEFLIVLPDTVENAGAEAIRRLQRELASRPLSVGSEPVCFTFSAGVVQVREGELAADAIARADQIMYAAKRAGRDRILVPDTAALQ
jgi:diguanylate cyclase